MSKWKQAIRPLTSLCLILSLTGLLWPFIDRAWASEADSSVKADANAKQERPDDKAPVQPAAKSAEPEVAALVNGEPVTRCELQRMLADPIERSRLLKELGSEDPDGKELDRLALRKLIHRRLILQEAERRSFSVTEGELDQAITALRRRFEDLPSFGRWMHERGLDDKSMFETVRAGMLENRVKAALVDGARVTEEQVQKYYESHKEDLKTAGDVRLRIIAVKDKATAEEIVGKLRNGEAFDRLARTRSIGLRAAQGGDTGWVDPRSLAQHLWKAVDTLKVGEVVGPLQSDDSFLIVGLAGRRPTRTKELVEARSEIEWRILGEQQQEVIQKWLTEQEKKSKIELFLQPDSPRVDLADIGD